MQEQEYNILLEKYNELINNPVWKATKPLRNVLDKFKSNSEKQSFLENPYESLLNSYNQLLTSELWILTAPIRKINVKLSKKKIRSINNKETENITKENSNEINIPKHDYKYESWIKDNESGECELLLFKYNPLISIIVPVYNVKSIYLNKCIESVLNQTYKNFELILIDDKSTSIDTINCLKDLQNNKNIKIIYKNENGGISAATNVGLKEAKGEYVGLLDNDDTLSLNALYEVVKQLNNNKDLEILYSDEDKIDKFDNRFFPVFKPCFSPELIANNNYICHFLVLRKTLVDRTGYMCPELDGAQDFDYVLRCIENTDINKIGHVEKVLYHWRAIEGSTSISANEKPRIKEVTFETKQRMIARRKIKAHIEEDGNIFYESDKKKVSIIIPSKDNFESLTECINSILKVITYPNYEIVIVDNGSNELCKNNIKKYIEKHHNIKYIYEKIDFNFSKQCQLGVDNSDGEYLLFLNDDIEVIQNDLLERMTGYASIPYVGAVGTKLIYPNSTIIQHCGVLNTFPGPVHYLQNFDDEINHHCHFNRIVTNVSAVTGACLMIERTKYENVGGFDFSFASNFNDVELCFKLLEKGYYNVVLNNIYSYHYEFKTRNKLDQRTILYQTKNLYDKHPSMYLNDKYYSNNYALSNINFDY